MALLFSYGILGFFSPDPVYLRSRSNLFALMWLIVSIVEFFAYGIYSWAFGYASERMVRRVRLSCFQSILRQNAAFFDRDEHSTGTLTQMLGQEATAMSGLSGLNLGAILTVFFGLTAGAMLAYFPLPSHVPHTSESYFIRDLEYVLSVVLRMGGNWRSFQYRYSRCYLSQDILRCVFRIIYKMM